jgi:arylsulfatase A-like enzyme
VYYTNDLQKSVAGLPFNIKHILTDAPLRRRGDQNLYNLEADPYELNDLSQEPEHQAKLRDFRDEVFKWWEETGGAQIP